MVGCGGSAERILGDREDFERDGRSARSRGESEGVQEREGDASGVPSVHPREKSSDSEEMEE